MNQYRIVRVEFSRPVSGPNITTRSVVLASAVEQYTSAQQVDAIEALPHGVRIVMGENAFTVPWPAIDYTQEVAVATPPPFQSMNEVAAGLMGGCAPVNSPIIPSPQPLSFTLGELLGAMHHKTRDRVAKLFAATDVQPTAHTRYARAECETFDDAMLAAFDKLASGRRMPEVTR